MNKNIVIALILILVAALLFFVLYERNTEVVVNEEPQETETVPGEEEDALDVLGTRYISAAVSEPSVDWPPRPWVSEVAYSCSEAGSPEDRAGESRTVTIDGQDWCRTVVSEGAAGSVYNQYSYTRPVEEGTQVVNFSLRFVQCLNYDEPERGECEEEQENFNADSIVAEIF